MLNLLLITGQPRYLKKIRMNNEERQELTILLVFAVVVIIAFVTACLMN